MTKTFSIPSRRNVLQLGAGLTAFSLGAHAWAAEGGSQKKLIVVFLRGAVDGLNVVVPHGDSAYYAARPSIAIPRPGRDGGAFDLDGQFGLNPALEPLMPFWRDGNLGFVHAAGSPDATRSHFDAQDYMETATPGRKTTPDGWMNRLVAVLPGTRTTTSALSFGPTTPRIFAGPNTVSLVPTGRAAERPTPLDRPIINVAFDRLYTGDDAMSRAYRDGVAAHKRVLADLQQDMMDADNGAPSAAGFPEDAERLTTLMARNPGIDLAFFALGGWDTHVNQGASEGQLAFRLRPLAQGLSVLANGLGRAYDDTVILVMSEFGRTVRENGNRGTDHGHGNAMWLLGGAVAGGKIHGPWPGLDEAALYEGRDLAVATDFRSVIGGVLSDHLKLDTDAIGRILPGAPKMKLGGTVRV